MKKKIKASILFLIMILAISCGKNEIGTEIDKNIPPDPSAVKIKLLGPWKITGFIDGNGKDYFNTTMTACEKDNVISYVNGYVTIDEGKLKCNIGDDQLVSDKFVIGGVTITTYAGNKRGVLERFEILLLNETTLKLKGANNSVITYTRQANVVIIEPLVGSWKMTGFIDSRGRDIWNSGYTVGNITYNKIEDCVKDDITTFTNNNQFINDEGVLNCNSTDPQIRTGTWDLSADRRYLTTKEGNLTETYLITLLNTTTLQITDSGDVLTYTKLP